MKTTIKGRRPQNIKSGISQSPPIGTFSNFKLKLRGPNWNLILIEMNMTSNGRRPRNFNSGISQQPLNESIPNFKLKLSGANQK